MTALALSTAASGLLRALVARSGAPRDQILVNRVSSTDWHSLTFAGERHKIALHLVGQHAEAFAERMLHRIEDCEFSIPGTLVADIAPIGAPAIQRDGSVMVSLEALTLVDA